MLPRDPRTRVSLGLAAVVVALLFVAVSGLRSITRLIRNDAWVTHTHEMRAGINEAMSLLSEAQAAHREYLLTGDPVLLVPFQQARNRVEGKLTTLLATTQDNPRHQQRLRALMPQVQAQFASMQSLADLRDRSGLAATASGLRRARANMLLIRSQLDVMDHEEEAVLGPRRMRAEDEARRAASHVVTMSLLGILVALVMARTLHRDLTARLQSEALYRTVVDVMAEGVVVQHGSGAVVDCNLAAERILGLPREHVLKLADKEWEGLREDGSAFPKTEHPALVSLRTGELQKNVVMGIHRIDGTLRWLLINTVPLQAQGRPEPIGVVSTFSDITRRREAEAAARDGQERLQDFLDNARDLIVTTDARGRILYANRAWREALGHDRDTDVVGKPFNNFVAPECVQGSHDAFRRLLGGETLQDFETTLMGPGGRRIAVSGNSNCRFENGKPVATRTIFHDVTELNVAHEQLIAAIEHADSANRAKSEFLANMSHELRTPLNSVIGFANVLLRNKGKRLEPQDTLYIERIQDNGKHLLGLINNVLDLSKVEAGRMELSLGETDLRALVRETLAQMESQVQGRPLTLCAELPARLNPLVTDAVKLKQVLINLVANALRFTESGSVTVRVDADAEGRPMTLEVVDTGIGITAERQTAVFEAFRQADNTTSRRFGGTGLGLTISRSLCQLMGYEINLASTVGVGTTFTVRFGSRYSAEFEAMELPADHADGRQVLVIDDDPDARLLLSQFVRDDGCDVIAASSGEQGLRLARERHPDLIMLDVVMPHMNGLEVLERLRADDDLCDIPVVIVSIVASEQRHRAIGAAALIDKPVCREEIEAVLREYVARPPEDRRGHLNELISQSLAVAV